MSRSTAALLASLCAVAWAVSVADARAGADDPGRVEALEREVRELRREVKRLESLLARTRDEARNAWRRRESWERLERGMSRFEVFAVLGEPGRVAEYDGFERWEYPDFLGGRVRFDDAGLRGWRLPPFLRSGAGRRPR